MRADKSLLKKCLIGQIVLFFFMMNIFAQNQNTSLIPKEVYVGDEAEIRFSFAWDGSLYSTGQADFKLVSGKNFSILYSTKTDNKTGYSFADYSIKNVRLAPSSSGYTLFIVFVPWKSGVLDIPAFDLADLFDISTRPLLIDIPQVSIQSIIQKTGEKNLRPPKGPLIIPGSTYVVFGFMILVFIAAVLFLFLALRFSLIKNKAQGFFRYLWASRNFRKSCRALLLLQKKKSEYTDADFAAAVSIIIRRYLENRFAHPFTAETSENIPLVFNNLFTDIAPTEAFSYMEDICSICVRCDFIRFAGEALRAAPPKADERTTMIETALKAFAYFEKNQEAD